MESSLSAQQPDVERGGLRVLAVLPAVPWPATTGGLQRTLTQLRGLDRRFELTVLALHRPEQDVAGFRRQLRGGVHHVPFSESRLSEVRSLARGLPLHFSRYGSPSMARALERLLRSQPFDVVHFDHVHMAQLLPLVRQFAPRARVVLDQHNVEAQVVERMVPLAKPHLRLPLRWHARRLRKLERRLVREVDAVLACSELDAAQFREQGARCVEVVPNASAFEPSASASLGRDVVYVGSFDWWPNIDGALHLGRDIWPRCAETLGDARLMIVGREPPPEVCALAHGRVVVTGSVPSVSPFLRGARVAAVPLRAGSGTRLKILEAWAHGLPVVSTPLGAEGLPVREGENMLLAESASDFADALVRVFQDDTLAARLSAGSLRTAQEFLPARIGERLCDFYRERLGT